MLHSGYTPEYILSFLDDHSVSVALSYQPLGKVVHLIEPFRFSRRTAFKVFKLALNSLFKT